MHPIQARFRPYSEVSDDIFVSNFAPQSVNEDAVVSVDASHPPDFRHLMRNDLQPPPMTLNTPRDPSDPDLSVELFDRQLWQSFSQVGTEMIVTKSGRRMFPGYRIKISGLDPNVQYCVFMDIVNVDDHRYKFQQGEWMVAGRGEPHMQQRLFLHPESPACGAKWMEDIVSFYKVKLTNSSSAKTTDKIVLNSMHRYQPRIHIVRSSDINNIRHQLMSTFAFPQTVFITVTAYQNSQVTKLKIDNNPFAKGFRDNGGRSGGKHCPSAENSSSKSRRREANSRENPGQDGRSTKRVKTDYEALRSTNDNHCAAKANHHIPTSNSGNKSDRLRNWMMSDSCLPTEPRLSTRIPTETTVNNFMPPATMNHPFYVPHHYPRIPASLPAWPAHYSSMLPLPHSAVYPFAIANKMPMYWPAVTSTHTPNQSSGQLLNTNVFDPSKANDSVYSKLHAGSVN